MKSRVSLSILVVLAAILACVSPDTSPDAGGGPVTFEPVLPTETLVSAASTETFTALPAPSATASSLSFTPSATQSPTITLTALPTNTLLPPLPDFDEVLGFALGGGGDFWPCAYTSHSRVVFGQMYGLLSRTAILCLWGVTFGDPFEIKMVSPDGQITLTENFLVDASTQQLVWLDRSSVVIDALNTAVGREQAGPYITIGFWWPVDLPLGAWQVDILRNGAIIAQGEFEPQQREWRRLSAIDTRSWTDIIPVDRGEAHSLDPQLAVQGVDVIGDHFAPNSYPVLLLYRHLREYDWGLIYKAYAPADERGILNAHIPGPLNEEYEYLLVAIADAGTSFTNQSGFLSDNQSVDRFNFKGPGTSLLASCPGAPPQRMVVGGRGYVCTQRDNVRLREASARTAPVIVSLVVDSEFTVMDGPACADDWSWWKIQTDDGYSGWISEGGDETDPYFICPLP